MTDNSNSTDILCPYCKTHLIDTQNSGYIENLIDDGNKIFYICDCGNILIVNLEIKEFYEYDVRKATEKEIQELEKINSKIEDIPGQMLLWG